MFGRLHGHFCLLRNAKARIVKFMFWKLHNMKAGDEKYYCRTIKVQKIRYIFLVRISCVQILTKCNIQILYILQAHLRPLESPAMDKQTKLPHFSSCLFSLWIVFFLRSFFCIPTPFPSFPFGLLCSIMFLSMFVSIETKY